MNAEERSKRRMISQLMKEAASIFTRSEGVDIAPAIPKMRAAVSLANELQDKTPLVICESNYASMAAVVGNSQEASEHIEHAIDVAIKSNLPTTIRNFVITKFVEISVLLKDDSERALTYARALIQSAIDEEDNYQQYLAAVFNLAVVAHELLDRDDWAVAILSWLASEDTPPELPIVKQSEEMIDKIAYTRGADPFTWVSEIEANRDFLLNEATDGFLPKYAPEPPDDSILEDEANEPPAFE